MQRAFQDPPDDSRILMRWWWFGPAVTEAELEREMRLMKEAGIGGVEIQPVYPLSLDDPARGLRNLPFLSPEFLAAVRFTSDTARTLGLRVDLTLGSGWPYGGPQVPITQAAGRLRVERVALAAGSRRVAVPDLGAGETLLAVFLARREGDAIVPGSVRELDAAAGGVVHLPAGIEGPHEVLFFISSRTGMMVKRPAVSAEGFVLDHYDRRAVEAYLESVGDRLLSAFGSGPPYAVFCDSLEVFDSDWTGDMLEEFQRRRGYSLRPHLPALVADMGPETAAIRHDWGRTLTELLDERFLAPLAAWAHRKGTRLRIQGYGIPPATIASNVHADLSEGEGHQWKALRSSRWASSANHLFGRAVTSAETWTWLHSPSFRATPLDMKAEADRHFLQGVNQIVGHGWPYTAEGVPYPGWRFYAAGAFDEKNPWWIAMPDVARTLQRSSFLLRQGRPVNDVALYLPNGDAWVHLLSQRPRYLNEALEARVGPDVIPAILDAGFNLDFFDDDTLRTLGHAEGRTLALGPNRYRAVVLPNVERIPVETLRTLEALARAGTVVVATRRRPEEAPGFLATPAERDEIRRIAQRLFGPGGAGRFVADERVGLGRTLADLLTPDVALAPPSPDVGFVHRRTADADVYFLANTANVPSRTAATFRVDARHAEWWDPLTGRVSPAATRPHGTTGATVELDLPPYGSRFLVFGARRSTAPRAGGAQPLPEPILLDSGWTLRFGEGAPVALDRLRSWTEDEGTRYFSGVATYERAVDIPPGFLRKGQAVRLEFGDTRPIPALPGAKPGMQAYLEAPVREAAVVHVNGRRAGSAWCPPYAVDLTDLLHPGTNTLRIEVGNLAVNHMAGQARPDYTLLNRRYGERFQAQDTENLQPEPAGLLGTIRLVAVPLAR